MVIARSLIGQVVDRRCSKALCDAGKLKEGEAKLIEAITIISFTMMN